MKLKPLTAATHRGQRKYQEDRYFQTSLDQGLVFGVFDGHGGAQCSDFCVNKFPELLIMELESGVFAHDAAAALDVAFQRLNDVTRQMSTGTTASVVFIPKDAAVAHVSVIGDSPVIIRSTGGPIWVAPEHNVRTNQVEAQAAIARGGYVYNGYLSASYSGSGLQMARALGDYELDRVLSRMPDSASIPLDAESWVLVATDGALDPSHVNEAEGIVALTELINGGADAQAIVDRALAIPTHDNVTALLVRVE